MAGLVPVQPYRHSIRKRECDKSIKIWDINKCCIRRSQAHSNLVKCLTKFRDTYFISGSKEKEVKVWDYTSMYNIYSIIGHTKEIYCVMTLNDIQIMSGSKDMEIKIWDIFI